MEYPPSWDITLEVSCEWADTMTYRLSDLSHRTVVPGVSEDSLSASSVLHRPNCLKFSAFFLHDCIVCASVSLFVK